MKNRKNEENIMRNTINTNNSASVFGRAMDNLFHKFGYVNATLLAQKDEEVIALLARVNALEEENRTYKALFDEVAEKQAHPKEVVVIKLPKKKTHLRVVGMKNVIHRGPYSKLDKVLKPVLIDGFFRTRNGKQSWVEPHYRSVWTKAVRVAA